MSKTLLRAGGRFLALGTLIVLVSSCGNKGPRLYPVTGVVVINGEPARDVNITFTPTTLPEGGATPLSPTAVTGEDGRFRLLSFKPGDGAPAGDYLVTIIYPMDRFNKHLSGIDRLKGKFADPQKSGLTAKVEAKPNDLPPFDLKAEVLPKVDVKDPLVLWKKEKKERSKVD